MKKISTLSDTTPFPFKANFGLVGLKLVDHTTGTVNVVDESGDILEKIQPNDGATSVNVGFYHLGGPLSLVASADATFPIKATVAQQ